MPNPLGLSGEPKSPTMPPEQLILTLLVEYMKCVTYELEVTIPLYRNQKRDKPFCYGLSLGYNHHP